MDYQERKAARLASLKRQMVVKWLAGAAVALAATVVAAFSPAASVGGRFVSVAVVGSDLAYEAFVDASLDDSGDAELRVVVHDQFEDRIQLIGAGMSSGVFTGLAAETDYRITLELNSGFGWRILARENVTTADGPGGAIVGYRAGVAEGGMYEGLWDYAVTVHVSDPLGTYESVWLRYSFLYDYETVSEPPVDRWLSAPIVGSDATVELNDQWREPLDWYWILEAETADGVVELDRRVVATPPVFYGSLYVADSGMDYVDASVHVYLGGSSDAVFFPRVHTLEGTLLDEIPIQPSATEIHSESPLPIRLDGLHKETEYRLDLVASYVDSAFGTTVEQLIASQNVWTMPTFSERYTIDEDDSSFIFRGSFDDPNGAIVGASYYVYRIVDGQLQYETSGQIAFDVDGDVKSFEQIVAKPTEPYRIHVYVSKRPKADTVYSCMIADIIRGAE